MSEDHLGKFVASKAGQTLLQDVHRMAEAVHQLAELAANPLRMVETRDEPALLAYVEEIARKHRQLLLSNHEDVVQEGEKPTWWFPRVYRPYTESYAFRRADDGFYRFEAILHGEAPDCIRAVTIIGDCDNDTYWFGGNNSRLAMAHLCGHSGPDYLLSKGSIKEQFTAAQARADFEAFCESNAKELEKSVAQLKLDLENHEGEDHAAEIADELRPLEQDVESWKDLAAEVGPAIENCAEGLQSMWDIIESAFDSKLEWERLKSFLPDRCDCNWGFSYDAMTLARVKQLRYFGLWLECHLCDTKVA
jgi:hypothetical protein